MSYITITGKCEEVDESSYTNQSTGKIVTRIRLSLVLPTMLDRWELDEAWVVVSAESMRALTFERQNARAGEKPLGMTPSPARTR